MSYLYEPLHPALLRLIGGVAEAARHAGISVTVCGEMAGDPTVVPVLLGLGIQELSMSAVAIPEVKSVVRAMTLAGARGLVDDVLTLPTADDVRAAVHAYMDTLGLAAKSSG